MAKVGWGQSRRLVLPDRDVCSYPESRHRSRTSSRQPPWRAGKNRSRDVHESFDLTAIAANAARKSADTAERTFTEVERPYVFVQTLRLAPNAQYILQNFGRTPAIVRWFTATVRTTGQPTKLLWNEVFNGQVILASGEERQFNVVGGAGCTGLVSGAQG